MVKRVTFDFETQSEAELKKTGGYKYSLDPTTKPTCLSFKIRGEPRTYLLKYHQVNLPWYDLPLEFRNFWLRLIRERYTFSAHNVFFDRCIYQNIMVKRCRWPEIPEELFRCTAAKAAACALPRNLEGAGEAVKLRVQKDRTGYVAMMRTCKPTTEWKKWYALQEKVKSGARITEKTRAKAALPPPFKFSTPEREPKVWANLYHYCKIDVGSEEELDILLPDLLPFEQEIWFLNQKLNWRGLHLDMPTAHKIVKIMGTESRLKLKELDALTLGLVTKPGARKSILDFLALDGIELPDIRAATVDKALKKSDLTEDARRLLEIRKALSKTSTTKYQSMIDRANDDFRVRDILMYHGASTGRDTGTGVQFHNFPRGLIHVDKNRPYAAVENIIECDEEMLRLLYGQSLAILFSSVLRNMLIPTKGYELFVADYSKVEVAVCWWLADNIPGLQILRTGKDPYIYQAAANLGKKYSDLNSQSPERQLGKIQVLGCQFGMGWERFQGAAAAPPYHLKLTDDQSKAAVNNYRSANPSVPQLWKSYERAAVSAVKRPGQMFVTNRCRFVVKDNFLWVYLPSGRPLAYRDPQIAWRETDYGPRETLEFWGVNPKTKKWDLERTWGGKITENIVQAVARDIMMPAMVRCEKKGYRALLMVHDEGICEKPVGEGSVKEFVEILCEVPQWAEGMPIEAAGWKGPRYRK